MHVHSLFFMLIMGLRLADGLLEKYKLENIVQTTEQRWKSFMMNAPILVIELDTNGNIKYITSFGLRLLGYKDAAELINVNWFDRFILPVEGNSFKNLYRQMLMEERFIPSFKNKIHNKNGEELLINWVNITSKDADGKIDSVMAIGTDITNEESANNLIRKLQLELEKEKITLEETKPLTNEGIIGSSKAMSYATGKAHQVATKIVPVLLEGETGVGKELFANLIHQNSSRSTMPFIKVNCAALPKELI
jgi:PAS domain S-box-containing protein